MVDVSHEFVAERLWLLVAVVTFPLTAIAGIAGSALFGPGAAVVGPLIFVLGYFLLVPLLLLFGEEVATAVAGPPEDDRAAEESHGDSASTDAGSDPLEELKLAYARGEVAEREFERRVERLVALDGVDASDADRDVLLGGDGAADAGARADRDAGEADAERREASDVEREL